MERREFLASLPVILPLSATISEEPRTAPTAATSSEAPQRTYLAYKAAACKAALEENRPIMEKIIKALWQLEDLCQEFFDETCAGCECTGWCAECEDVDGLRYQVRLFTCMFESSIVAFPEMIERRKERGYA